MPAALGKSSVMATHSSGVAATLLKIHAVLRVALADAERRDLVPRNVAEP